jgi:hypothetical protein
MWHGAIDRGRISMLYARWAARCHRRQRAWKTDVWPDIFWSGLNLNRSGSEALRLQTCLCGITCRDYEVGEMSFELVAPIMMALLDGRLLNRSVYAFGLTVSPGRLILECPFDKKLRSNVARVVDGGLT